jgi:hypothetical protein
VGIGQFHGIVHSVATAIGAATTEAPHWPGGRQGRIPEGLFAPGTVTVPLRSLRKASPFWAILLLVSAPPDHGLTASTTEIDSVISRFESWHPSQPPGSLPGDFGYPRKRRPFRRLAAKSPVSGGEFQRIRAEGRESRGESLLDDFQYPKFGSGAVQRPVAFETGSMPGAISSTARSTVDGGAHRLGAGRGREGGRFE